ncbi:MAG TPA: hypothetical protein VGD59_01215 [Acidisarcina sp.]
MTYNKMVEKFPVVELANLRNELLQSGLDSWQAAEVVSYFLAGRGYGTNSEDLRSSVHHLEDTSCTYERMQEVLERVAFVM